MLHAIYAHKRLRQDFGPGGASKEEVDNMFRLLETMDSLKNAGLYVDHTSSKVEAPNDISPKELKYVIEVAEMFIAITSEEIAHKMGEREKKLHQEELRSLAREARTKKDDSE